MGNSRLMNDARIRIHVELNADDTLTVSILDSGEGITHWVKQNIEDGEGIPVLSEQEANGFCRWHCEFSNQEAMQLAGLVWITSKRNRPLL